MDLSVCRYVERHALGANLTARAEEWRWSSLWHRRPATQVAWLSDWPVAMPTGWSTLANRPQPEAEQASLRRCVQRGAPYGDAAWQARTAAALGLEASLRGRGRPRKAQEKET